MKRAVIIFWSKTGNTEKVAYSIRDGLEDAGVEYNIDLLSIDSEGMDARILKDLLSSREYRPGVIVTERISHQNSDAMLEGYGYEFMGITGPEDNPYGNGFYTRLGMPSDDLYAKTTLRRPA